MAASLLSEEVNLSCLIAGGHVGVPRQELDVRNGASRGPAAAQALDVALGPPEVEYVYRTVVRATSQVPHAPAVCRQRFSGVNQHDIANCTKASKSLGGRLK